MDILQEINKTAFSCMGKGFYAGLSGPHAFDRQGLVYYIFNNSGIPLPRMAINELYYDDIYLMDVEEGSYPQTGDIFFFGENGYSYTAGIFLGQENNSRVICLFDLGKDEDGFFTRDITVTAIPPIDLRMDFLKYRRHVFVNAIVNFKRDLQNPLTLFSTQCENNALFQWGLIGDPDKAFSFSLVHNNSPIYQSVAYRDFYIARNLAFETQHEFFIRVSRPLGEKFKSNTISLYFIKPKTLCRFKNDFVIPDIDKTKTNKFDFNVFAQIWNREFPAIKTNLVLMSRRVLDEPIYPYNFFRLDLIGEKQRGTEFYYDIQTEITTGDDLAFNVITPMFYYNQGDNGTFSAPLALTSQTVYELSRQNVLRTLQDNDENYIDLIRPTFNVKYDFRNDVPFYGVLSLFKQGKHEFMLNQTSDTEIIMGMVIPNTERLTIRQFMDGRLRLYCPGMDTSRLLRFSVIIDGIEKTVEGGLI